MKRLIEVSNKKRSTMDAHSCRKKTVAKAMGD